MIPVPWPRYTGGISLYPCHICVGSEENTVLAFTFKKSEPHRFVNEVESNFVKEYGEQSEEHCEDGIGYQKRVPKPNSEVDLFVDYVLQKRGIMYFISLAFKIVLE